MLREVLLSLSGIPSPVLDTARLNGDDEIDTGEDDALKPYTSIPEREMLKTLAELADLHIKVRELTLTISRSSSSPICRVVSTSIRTDHLQAFRENVVAVESLVLKRDAAYVGAYRIVPLSTIVTEFQPWSKPLRWMSDISQLLKTDCSSTQLLHHLRKATRTGYDDIHALSTSLLIVAEQAWINCLMPWLLYGQLPYIGKEDFMVKSQHGKNGDDFYLDKTHVPFFVSVSTAEAVFAIGKALHYIRSRKWSAAKTHLSSDVCQTLLPFSLQSIQSLDYPLQSSAFTHVISAINVNMSEQALSHFLPATAILELLVVVENFVLLLNSDFSDGLIDQVNLQLKTQQGSLSKPVRKLGKYEEYIPSETVLTSIMAKVWSDMPVPIHETPNESRSQQKTTSWLILQQLPRKLPINTLFPTSVALTLRIPTESPLHMFLTPGDVQKYTDISAYLVSVKRARLGISAPFQMPNLRKIRFTRSSSAASLELQRGKRLREEKRGRVIRPYWVCASHIAFLLSETLAYLYSEVIENSLDRLQTWLESQSGSRPPSSRLSSRPTTASSRQFTVSTFDTTDAERKSTLKTDPRILVDVHHKYLDALYSSLLLNDEEFTSVLSELLNLVDHFTALFGRLQIIWQGLDLQEDENIKNTFSDYHKEESELLTEMQRTNASVNECISDLIDALRAAEKQESTADISDGLANVNFGEHAGEVFQPWRAKTLDRLLMKLETLASKGNEDKFEDAALDLHD